MNLSVWFYVYKQTHLPLLQNLSFAGIRGGVLVYLSLVHLPWDPLDILGWSECISATEFGMLSTFTGFS